MKCKCGNQAVYRVHPFDIYLCEACDIEFEEKLQYIENRFGIVNIGWDIEIIKLAPEEIK